MQGRNWFVVGALALAVNGADAQPVGPAGALPWPHERPATLPADAVDYGVPKSNYVVDLHGSTHNPDLVLFMAGNQYRVMPDLIRAYQGWIAAQPEWRDVRAERVFYATTPPGRLIDAMVSGKLEVGNLWLDVAPGALWPDVFMTGPRQHQRLRQLGHVEAYFPYARNRGVGLLVKAGNPKQIRTAGDLARPDVRVAISSPRREPASYESYAAVIKAQAAADLADRVLAKPSTITPKVVHHRENPQFIADGHADVAPMYWHFGDYLKRHFPTEFEFVDLPADGNEYALLGVASIQSSPRPRAARAWIEFLLSDTAAAIYERHGFTAVPRESRMQAIRLP